MSAESSLNTLQLQNYVARIKSGDRAALDELLRRVARRLEELGRKMFKRYPNVRSWTDLEDVLQEASLRLIRSLEKLETPGSMREFYGLAALQIRRELIDLARHHASSKGQRAVLQSVLTQDQDDSQGPHPVAEIEDPDELDRWVTFHRLVEELPPEEREAVGLLYYHGWKQADVAALFGVSERTVRRRWDSAMEKIGKALRERDAGGNDPASPHSEPA